MNAFEIRDGRAVRVEYHGLEYRRHYEPAPEILPIEPMRRLRRRLARRGTRGRRTARMVGLWPEVVPALKMQTLVAHRLGRSYKQVVNGWPQDVREECIVYLPQGDRVTPEVIRAVTVAWGRST